MLPRWDPSYLEESSGKLGPWGGFGEDEVGQVLLIAARDLSSLVKRYLYWWLCVIVK